MRGKAGLMDASLLMIMIIQGQESWESCPNHICQQQKVCEHLMSSIWSRNRYTSVDSL